MTSCYVQYTQCFPTNRLTRNNDCCLKFERLMVKIICKIDPSYEKYVHINKTTGKKKLHGKFTEVDCGILLGVVLFCQKSSGQLYEWGYEQKPYDQCTFNKMINGKQWIIKFHVDDIKSSSMEHSVLSDLVKELNNVFSTNKKELVGTKGGFYEYLGLTIDFSGRYDPDDPDKKGQVIFTMYNYI